MANITYMLGRYRPTRLDDGDVHHVRVLYLPPVQAVDAMGRLELYLDRQKDVTFSLPITLPYTSQAGQTYPGTVSYSDLDRAHRAYMGFTASTGEASERHDILNASFCHRLGCSVL